MSTPVPFLPPLLAAIDEMLTTKTIPTLSGDEMEFLCSHLFRLRNRDLQIAIAEIAYLNHDDPQALSIFLACTMPMAYRMAERRAGRVFVHPTAWQVEAMYDGVVTNLLEMFEAHRPPRSIPNAFRRYLMRTIIFGTMYAFHLRQENWHIEGVEDITKFFPSAKDRYRNPADRDMITRELLEQVTTFPHLREEHARMLKTIAALGPEKALRHDNCYWKNGRHEPASKQVRRRRAMLDLPAVAEAMGVKYLKAQHLLKQTREILRDFFNHDGSLFANY
jgi:hypothetical protein